jgi:hypothetical protein
MTLCKYRPQRTYDAQFIFEQNDVNGLLKKLTDKLKQLGNDGEKEALFYMGALSAFEAIFSTAEHDGIVDMWSDFLELFDADIKRWE